MALTVLVAPPAWLLTTVGRIKLELEIPDSSYDDLLIYLLEEASSAIAAECGRPFFGVGTYSETLKGTGSQLLAVSCVPILTITSILQDTLPLDPTDPNDGYSIEDADAGAIYRSAGWGQTVALLSWGWEAYSSRYILPGGTSTLRYTVTYTAGWELPGQPGYTPWDPTNPASAPPLPGDLIRACIETVKAWWFARNRNFQVQSEATADQKITYTNLLSQSHVLPVGVLGLLRDYRRVN